MVSAGSAMAFGFGPIAGGLISEYFGWKGLFAVTCLVLAVLPILWRLLPKEQSKPFRFDVIGAVLTVLNAATLLAAVTQRSLVWLVASILTFALHGLHLRNKQEPFIAFGLLAKPAYMKLVAIGFFIQVLNLGNLFLMPLALANLFKEPAMTIGFMIAPGAILSAFLTRFVGRWIERYGNLRFLLLRHILLAIVLALYSMALAVSPAVVLCGFLVFSPALSATIASLNNESLRILPREWLGSGLGLLQLIQFFGGSFSVAVCGLLLTLQKSASLVDAYRHVYWCFISLKRLFVGDFVVVQVAAGHEKGNGGGLMPRRLALNDSIGKNARGFILHSSPIEGSDFNVA